MTALAWNQVGERIYETGVDHGVLYLPDINGDYVNGYAWNGLTTVTESPSGAESTAFYADNIKYLNLVSTEEFSCTIEAVTYPDEFDQCDGIVLPLSGVAFNQQTRKLFGLSYRTQLGNDVDSTEYGYKLHLVYGCLAAPSEKTYETINDSPEAIVFSWEITTTPALCVGYDPVALITIDSTQVEPSNLQALEDLLYGTSNTNPSLPSPQEILDIMGSPASGELAIIDYGNGDWAAIDESNLFITMIDADTFEITSPTANYIDADTFSISSTV